jgi:hypothetical protein
MTLAKMGQLTLSLETVKFQLSNWSTSDITFNVEVWEDTLTVSFNNNSDFAFFDLQANGVFGNWKFNQDILTMSVEL